MRQTRLNRRWPHTPWGFSSAVRPSSIRPIGFRHMPQTRNGFAVMKGHEMREEGIVKRKEFKLSILELEFRTSTSPPKPSTLFRRHAERKNFPDFAFMWRQRRITIDATDYKMDLLLFHRLLRRLIVVDLKVGKFKPEYKGQMELYLRYLDKNIRKPWEDKCKKY